MCNLTSTHNKANKQNRDQGEFNGSDSHIRVTLNNKLCNLKQRAAQEEVEPSECAIFNGQEGFLICSLSLNV